MFTTFFDSNREICFQKRCRTVNIIHWLQICYIGAEIRTFSGASPSKRLQVRRQQDQCPGNSQQRVQDVSNMQQIQNWNKNPISIKISLNTDLSTAGFKGHVLPESDLEDLLLLLQSSCENISHDSRQDSDKLCSAAVSLHDSADQDQSPVKQV